MKNCHEYNDFYCSMLFFLFVFFNLHRHIHTYLQEQISLKFGKEDFRIEWDQTQTSFSPICARRLKWRTKTIKTTIYLFGKNLNTTVAGYKQLHETLKISLKISQCKRWGEAWQNNSLALNKETELNIYRGSNQLDTKQVWWFSNHEWGKERERKAEIKQQHMCTHQIYFNQLNWKSFRTENVKNRYVTLVRDRLSC